MGDRRGMKRRERGGWAEKQFGGARLSDVRRIGRVVTIAEAMVQTPGASMPKLFETPYEVKAAYNLFSHQEATPERLQAGHRRQTLRRMQETGTVTLLLEDTSTCSWSGQAPIEGLGPVNDDDGSQGFQMHTTMGVRWTSAQVMPGLTRRPPLEILGLADQQFHVRGAKKSEKIPRKVKADAASEGHWWEDTSRNLGQAPADTRWVRVCDRGADIYEFLVSCQSLGHGFVVRASQNRALWDLAAGQSADKLLFETVRQASSLVHFDLVLRSRPGQAARTAKMGVAAVRVGLRSPQRPGHAPGTLPPIACLAVRVWELESPVGVTPLEWILLCDAQTVTAEIALTCAVQYACRWLIEEFHKAVKTGLGAERLQLEHGHRLQAAIAIMSVVALRLLHLREMVRLQPEAPATAAGLTDLELTLLAKHLRRNLANVREVALALGRLGGHMNRKADGLPGWQTLWSGMLRLQFMVKGASLLHD